MPLILADRVQQTGTANTTVSFTLSGSVTGFQTFAAANITTNDTTYYAATDASGNWEVGVGTYSTVGPTLTRTTILSSSNSGSAVTFSGTVNVFVTYPSERSVYSNGTNIVPDNAATLLTTSGGTGLSSYTAGDLPYYATGTALSKLTIGASGRWLGSSGTAPQWNAPAALTKTDDTNVTLTLGGSASTSLLNAASLTLGWTGQLATTRGGTGLSSFTANGIVYASSTSALATGSTLTFNGTTLTAPGISDAGNLTFTGTGNRITGDFSNATLGNRVAFQSSTTNGSTNVQILPNGTATTTRLNLLNTTDTTNYSVGSLLTTNAEVRLVSDAAGSGTQLPMTFYTGGSERMRLNSSGQLILNTTGTAYTTGGLTAQYQIGGTTQSASSMSLITSNATTTTDPVIFLAKNKSGTQGTFTTAVVNTDELGAIQFAGSNTSTLATGAEIKGVAKGTWTTGSQPTDLVFSTVQGGTTTLNEALRLTQNQEVLVGAGASGVTDVAGFGLTTMSSSGGFLNFYRNDASVVAGNSLGIIDFYSNGSGSILYAATIEVEAGGTFTASSTPSEIVFFTCPSGSTTTAEAVRIKSGGGLQISRTAVTAPATGDGNVFSGTYTPQQVLTNTNVAAVSFSICQYMRVGATVTVSGQIAITATTAATDTVVKMTVPIATLFGASRQLAGAGVAITTPYAQNSLAFLADTTNESVDVRLRPTVNTALTYNFSFTYLVS